MPTYDYFCEANRKTVEVHHPIGQDVQTWGELCALAKIDAGKTPRSTKVSKLFNGGYPVGGASTDACATEACEMPPSMCCGGGACGLN
jgi:hypothetical protein